MKIPRILKGPKNCLITGFRVFEGLLTYWGFLFENLIWIPIVQFGEVLSSLFPVESCGDSMCTALLKMAQKWSWIESHQSDAALLLRLLPGCSPGTVNSYCYQMGPVWLQAGETELGNSVQDLLAVSVIPLEECPALRKIAQMRQGSLTFTIGSGNGARPLATWVSQLCCPVAAQHYHPTSAERGVLFTFCFVPKLWWGL